MTPATLIAQAAAEGISLAVSDRGNIKAIGGGEVVRRWVPVLRQHMAAQFSRSRIKDSWGLPVK